MGIESIPTNEKKEIELIFEEYKNNEETSGDYWYSAVVDNLLQKTPGEIENEMLKALKAEVPMLCSSIMERGCNFSCKHCLYKKERLSEEISKKVGLENIIYNIVNQLPTKENSLRNKDGEETRSENPSFLHTGRILKGWHLNVFKKIREMRPDVKIGLIDNGTYTKFIDKFKEKNVKLDWLDISVDGTREFHNLQRGNDSAFDIAINGLRHAREIVRPPEEGGRVTALFTLDNLNYQDKNIEKTANLLFDKEKHLVDELNITTVTATRESLKKIIISPNYKEGDVEDFKEAWDQLKNIFKKYGIDSTGKQKVHIRIYRHEDVEKIAYAVGAKKFMDSVIVNNAKDNREMVGVDIGKMVFKIDDVPVEYFPCSIWPHEEFNIDVDGANRTALSMAHTLEDLQYGKDKEDGSDTRGYTVDYLNDKSDYIKTYHKEVDQWWNFKGKEFLKEEIETFDRIRKVAEADKIA